MYIKFIMVKLIYKDFLLFTSFVHLFYVLQTLSSWWHSTYNVIINTWPTFFITIQGKK